MILQASPYTLISSQNVEVIFFGAWSCDPLHVLTDDVYVLTGMK